MYRAVGNRIAVDITSLDLPIKETEALAILGQLGFQICQVSIVEEARKQVGKPYRRGALPQEAPEVFDCSGLSKWVYGQKGVWLPRYSIDQRDAGRKVIQIQPGDLLFVSSSPQYYWHDPNDGVGHVGIATGDETVIHAANSQRGVVEDPVNSFLTPTKNFRGIRRYVPANKTTYTLIFPPQRFIETSRELRWKILQCL